MLAHSSNTVGCDLWRTSSRCWPLDIACGSAAADDLTSSSAFIQSKNQYCIKRCSTGCLQGFHQRFPPLAREPSPHMAPGLLIASNRLPDSLELLDHVHSLHHQLPEPPVGRPRFVCPSLGLPCTRPARLVASLKCGPVQSQRRGARLSSACRVSWRLARWPPHALPRPSRPCTRGGVPHTALAAANRANLSWRHTACLPSTTGAAQCRCCEAVRVRGYL